MVWLCKELGLAGGANMKTRRRLKAVSKINNGLFLGYIDRQTGTRIKRRAGNENGRSPGLEFDGRCQQSYLHVLVESEGQVLQVRGIVLVAAAALPSIY